MAVDEQTARNLLVFLDRVQTKGLQEAEELTRCARVLSEIVNASQSEPSDG